MNWVIKSLLAFALPLFAMAMPYDDKDFGCITEQKAQRFSNDFNINERSFGGRELCDSNVDTKKLFNDLELVELGQFSGTTSNVFILNKVDRNNYYEWLKEQTRGVRRGSDMPTATAYNSGGYFTMQDGWAKLSTLGRVGTIIHEARHTEGYRHRRCHHGPYEGDNSLGCDNTVNEGGSHGVEMEYYSRVSLQGENFHPVYQSMARLMTTARSNFVFNQDPMTRTEGLVAQAGNQLITLLNDQTTELNLAQPLEANDRLKRTSFGISLFSPDTPTQAIDLLVTNPEVEVEDQYSYFKLTTVRPLEQILDMEEIDLGVRRYFVAVDQQSRIYRYNFSEGDWSAPVQSRGVVRFATRGPDGQHGLFGITQNREYCQLSPTSLRCKKKLTPWPAEIDQVVQYGTLQLILKNGAVFEANSQEPFAPLKNYAVEQLVEVPFYNVF